MSTSEKAVRSVDLNADLGEGCEGDVELLTIVTSANVACGLHAGDPSVMARTVADAAAHRVAIGAHPGLADRENFGRVAIGLTAAQVYDLVLYQIGALAAFAQAADTPLRHVKPHGALYHMAERDRSIAEAIIQATRAFGAKLIVVGLAGGTFVSLAAELGSPIARELFADRGYDDQGRLVPRGELGDLLHREDAARRMARWAATGLMATASGGTIPIEGDTICVHGDAPDSLATARAVRDALTTAGIRIAAIAP